MFICSNLSLRDVFICSGALAFLYDVVNDTVNGRSADMGATSLPSGSDAHIRNVTLDLDSIRDANRRATPLTRGTYAYMSQSSMLIRLRITL